MNIETMKQVLNALEIGYESVKTEAEISSTQWRGFDGRHTAIYAEVEQIADAITTLRAAIKQAEKQLYKLSCGCPSQYGGIPAEWATTDRDGNSAVAYGVICEKHWHEYDAQHPQRAWQGLTKDEVNNWTLPDKPTVFAFCQFVEAKLKEKNT
jgi:hypothetical protein